MKTNRLLLRTTLVLAFCQSGLLLASTDNESAAPAALPAVSAQTPATTERAVHDEMHRALLRLAESGALGNTPDKLSLDVSESAQRSNNLGLLLDSTNPSADGVHVLGVTPGGSAERMGVHAGDVVTAVNGRTLQKLGLDAGNRPLAPGALKDGVDQLKDGEPLRLEVVRGGNPLVLNAPVHSLYLPAMRLQLGTAALLAADTSPAAPAASGGCGQISEFDVAPRQEHLHRAVIIKIDGKNPGPHGQETFRVSTGPHVLEIAEAIESRYLAFNDRIRMANSTYKKLTVDVAANTTYLIAVRLNPETRDDPRKYWDPVMWKQSAETCR